MTSELKLAMPTIFLHEGRRSNNVNDPGGLTDYGVSLRFLMQTGDLDKDGWQDGDINHDGVIDAKDIDAMTPEEATKIYNLYWWEKYGYGRIENQIIATKVLDFSINMGHIGAHKCIQRAVRAANSKLVLTDDGILGDKSFGAINSVNPEKLQASLKSEAAGYYRSIKFKDPTKDAKVFLKGWLNRAYSEAVLCLG